MSRFTHAASIVSCSVKKNFGESATRADFLHRSPADRSLRRTPIASGTRIAARTWSGPDDGSWVSLLDGSLHPAFRSWRQQYACAGSAGMFSAVRLPRRTRDSTCQHVAAPSFEGDGMRADAHQKIKPTHLKRTAYLYIRQSTLRQVFENVESTQRQYALRQHAIALGWQQEQIVVIDSDLGQSGASAADREGFQRLVTEVSLGRAGIVLGLEVSRLARNSTDWHRLLEICALTDALILDEDGIYDPAHFNDRLLLGLKGTMSEAELHVLRARLQGGILNKARRGELMISPPVGLIYNSEGALVLDPDKHVQQCLRLLFETFRSTGSAMATVKG